MSTVTKSPIDSARLRVVYAGTPAFAVPPLAALLASPEVQVVGVLTQPDRPFGRGRHLQPGAVKQFARKHQLAVLQPERVSNNTDLLHQLATMQPDVIMVTAYGLILPVPMLQLPRYGCINVHASLLPRWRGAAPVERAILAGDQTTGISMMQMDAGLDTGDILLQMECRIDPQDTAGDDKSSDACGEVTAG